MESCSVSPPLSVMVSIRRIFLLPSTQSFVFVNLACPIFSDQVMRSHGVFFRSSCATRISLARRRIFEAPRKYKVRKRSDVKALKVRGNWGDFSYSLDSVSKVQ